MFFPTKGIHSEALMRTSFFFDIGASWFGVTAICGVLIAFQVRALRFVWLPLPKNAGACWLLVRIVARRAPLLAIAVVLFASVTAYCICLIVMHLARNAGAIV